MPQEHCSVGNLTPLSTALQRRYDQLEAPQCTNLTYIYTFFYKMILMTSHDAEIRNILCHLNDAASNLNLIHVSIYI